MLTILITAGHLEHLRRLPNLLRIGRALHRNLLEYFVDRINPVSPHSPYSPIPIQTLPQLTPLSLSSRSVCVLFVGACTGPIFDAGHLRLLLLIGSFGVVFGFMMLSLCTEFWQALLAQGFVIGLGGGMLFVPSVAILPTYFSTKIGLAIGLAASGSSMGGE